MSASGLSIEYGREANAIYVRLGDKPYGCGEEFGLERRIDYAADGIPIGVEFTGVDEGVDLSGIPSAEKIAEAIEKQDIRVFA